jgi:U3 small nucleolar RNA-associated protein 14
MLFLHFSEIKLDETKSGGQIRINAIKLDKAQKRKEREKAAAVAESSSSCSSSSEDEAEEEEEEVKEEKEEEKMEVVAQETVAEKKQDAEGKIVYTVCLSYHLAAVKTHGPVSVKSSVGKIAPKHA